MYNLTHATRLHTLIALIMYSQFSKYIHEVAKLKSRLSSVTCA